MSCCSVVRYNKCCNQLVRLRIRVNYLKRGGKIPVPEQWVILSTLWYSIEMGLLGPDIFGANGVLVLKEEEDVKYRINIDLRGGNNFIIANARFFDPLLTRSQYAAGRLKHPMLLMIPAITFYGSCRVIAAANGVLIVKKVNIAHRHLFKQ